MIEPSNQRNKQSGLCRKLQNRAFAFVNEHAELTVP